MSRSRKDKAGGHYSKFGWRAGAKWPAELMRAGRRTSRHKAKHALQKGDEPEPIYPIEREYLD